jgi:hypothetical protein
MHPSLSQVGTDSMVSDLDLRSSDRLARVGRALMALSHELAASRREVFALKRENTALRARLALVEERETPG